MFIVQSQSAGPGLEFDITFLPGSRPGLILANLQLNYTTHNSNQTSSDFHLIKNAIEKFPEALHYIKS